MGEVEVGGVGTGGVRVGAARRVARRWVAREGAALPGFAGAFLTGSALWAPAGTLLGPASDVDVMVVLDAAEPPVKPGKFRYDGVLLEVSYLPAARLGSAEDVLRDHHLAGAFHLPGVLADPTGRLEALHRTVSGEFAAPHWVRARTAAVLDLIRRTLDQVEPAAEAQGSAVRPEAVNAWLFGTGITAHVPLVAALRNPTVRSRYAATRELLAGHGLPHHHERLLELLGCAELGAGRVERHLGVLEWAFDAAERVTAESYPFASDVSASGRPVSIGGSRDLIARGLHREAVFWLVATYARCLTKLSLAGADGSPYEDGFRDLLADLGADTPARRHRRAEEVRAALPWLRGLAEELTVRHAR